MADKDSYLCMNVLYYDSETEKKVKTSFKESSKAHGELSFLEVEDWTNKLFCVAKSE